MRCSIIAAAFLLLATANPACAYWRYAEWGMTQTQVMSAGRGQAAQCQPHLAGCDNGAGLVIENTQMLGLPCAVTFFFDEQGRLNRTVVTFARTDFAMVANLLQGIHGSPVSQQPGGMPSGVWRDTRRGSTITLSGAGPIVTMSYRPTTP
jgi:hypothetical protein